MNRVGWPGFLLGCCFFCKLVLGCSLWIDDFPAFPDAGEDWLSQDEAEFFSKDSEPSLEHETEVEQETASENHILPICPPPEPVSVCLDGDLQCPSGCDVFGDADCHGNGTVLIRYRSIGPSKTFEATTATITVAQGSTLAYLTQAPENTRPGDRIVFCPINESPSCHPQPYFVLRICRTSLQGDVIVLQQPVLVDYQKVGFRIARAYASLQDWTTSNTDTEGDLAREIGLVYVTYNDLGIDEHRLLVERNDTNENFYRVLTAGPGLWHQGNAPQGVVLDGGDQGSPKAGITIREPYFRLSNLVFKNFASTVNSTSAVVRIEYPAKEVRLDRLLVSGNHAAVDGIAIESANAILHNSFLVGLGNRAIHVQPQGQIGIASCTIRGFSTGVFVEESVLPQLLINTISVQNIMLEGNDLSWVTASHLVYDEFLLESSTSGCSNCFDTQMCPIAFVGDQDSHLTPTDCGIDQAMELDGFLQDRLPRLNWDIDGEFRPQGLGWDIGADEVKAP